MVLEALTIGVSTVETSTRSTLRLLDDSLLSDSIGTDLSYTTATFALLAMTRIPSGAMTRQRRLDTL